MKIWGSKLIFIIEKCHFYNISESLGWENQQKSPFFHLKISEKMGFNLALCTEVFSKLEFFVCISPKDSLKIVEYNRN